MFAGAAYEELGVTFVGRGTACIRCRGVQNWITGTSAYRKRLETCENFAISEAPLPASSSFSSAAFGPALRNENSRVWSFAVLLSFAKLPREKPTLSFLGVKRDFAGFASTAFENRFLRIFSGWITNSRRNCPQFQTSLRLPLPLRESWRKSWNGCRELLNNN